MRECRRAYKHLAMIIDGITIVPHLSWKPPKAAVLRAFEHKLCCERLPRPKPKLSLPRNPAESWFVRGIQSTYTGSDATTHALRALKHRNYQLFFSGQLISLIGTWMQSVAQMWLVYRLSRSSLLLGQ